MDNTNHNDFYFQVGSENIRATIDYQLESKIKPTIMSLHGAGPSNRNRIVYLTSFLARNGHSCLRFDFSGHPDSTGRLEDSSLKKRLDEALSASTFLRKDSSHTIIATSMAGHIALELLPLIDVKNLILFCPAAYSSEAFDIPFAKGFSEIIRQPNSFKNAKIFDNLKSFTGNLLFFIGEKDEIIPKEVTNMYIEYSANCSKREFVFIPDAPHALHAWLSKESNWRDIVLDKALNFIR